MIIFDQSKRFPIFEQGNCILPVEALLSSIEVKSKLTKTELSKALSGAKKLRALQPYRKPLAKKSVTGPEKGKARFFIVFLRTTQISLLQNGPLQNTRDM